MSLLRTITMLGSAVLLIFFFYCIGYAIANHDFGPVVVGVGALAGSLVLAFLQVRVRRT